MISERDEMSMSLLKAHCVGSETEPCNTEPPIETMYYCFSVDGSQVHETASRGRPYDELISSGAHRFAKGTGLEVPILRRFVFFLVRVRKLLREP